MIKPHGSVDFGLPEWIVAEAVEWSYYAQTDLQELQNNYYVRVPRERLGDLRVSCDVVLPTDYNRIRDYSFVHEGYEQVYRLCADLDELVFAGLSYWHCDRPELDSLTSHLAPKCLITMMNPCPSAEWVDYLRSRGFVVRVCTSPGEMLAA